MESSNKVEEGLAWERLAFGKELERIRAETDTECLAIQTDFIRRGLGQSGMFLGAVIAAQERMMRKIADARIGLRRRIVGTVLGLGSAQALEYLENEIIGFVDSNWKNIHNSVVRWVGRSAFTDEMVPKILQSPQYADVPLRINSVVKRDLATLRHEVNLGMHDATPARPEPSPAPPAGRPDADRQYEKDVFISHASDDKESAARPIAEGLEKNGLRVWFDEYELTVGDRLLARIEDGIRTSRFGTVILSHSFFAKNWPQRELDGLVALTEPGKKKILPVWHGLGSEDVARYSPTLAGVYAARTANGIPSVIDEIWKAVRREMEREQRRPSLEHAERNSVDQQPGGSVGRPTVTQQPTGSGVGRPTVTQQPAGSDVARPTITIEGPFQSHPNMDAKWAQATVRVQNAAYRVAALISGPSETAIIGSGPDGRLTDLEREEARTLFALAELANRPVKDLEPPRPGHLAEIRVEIGEGPDSGPRYRGMWTLPSIRKHERLRGYTVERMNSTWTAVPKS